MTKRVMETDVIGLLKDAQAVGKRSWISVANEGQRGPSGARSEAAQRDSMRPDCR